MHPAIPFQMTLADYKRYRRAYRAMVACGCDHGQTLATLANGYTQTLEQRRAYAIRQSQQTTARYLTRAEGR